MLNFVKPFTVVNYKAQRATWGHDRTRKILSSYLVVQVARGLGQGYATIGDRTRTEMHFPWLHIQSSFPGTTLYNIKKHIISRIGWDWAITMLILVSCLHGVVGADFYFMCALETLWWVSVCLPIGGVLLLLCCLPTKKVFTVNEKAVWFIAMAVGRRGHVVWLLNRRWLLFKFNEVKKRQVNWLQTYAGKLSAKLKVLLECECLQSGHNTLISTAPMDPLTFTVRRLHYLLHEDTVSGQQ